MPTQPAILGTMRLGNFRLGYVPAALAAVRRTSLTLLLAGVDARIRVSGLSIRDVLNDAPNACSLVVDDANPPTTEQSLRIVMGVDAPRVLFAGTLQTVDLAYEVENPVNRVWPCAAIDDTARFNRKRPFGTFVSISATTIAQTLATTYAPAFGISHIEAGLPTVSIIFDGSDDLIGAFTRLATAIGGYSKVEDGEAYLFLEDLADPPDAIDSTPGRFLNDPPITCSQDVSQLRTRVSGKGHGEATLSDVLAGETIVPIADGVMFGTIGAGGRAIAGTTPDGAQSQQIAYTGVQRGGAGSLVGPGASPSVAPTLTIQSGAGLAPGVYQYGYTDKTATGESLLSPLATVTITGVTAPPSAPSAGPPLMGPGVDAGSHDYVTTYVSTSGETTPGPSSPAVVTRFTAPPAIAPDHFPPNIGGGGIPSGSYEYLLTYHTAVGETLPGPSSAPIVVSGPTGSVDFFNLPVCATEVANRRLFRRDNGTGNFRLIIELNATGTTYRDQTGGGGGTTAAPSVSTATVNVVPVGLPIGDATVTARKLYRRFNGAGTFKLVATLADNVTTSYTDTTANASLGAAAPSTNTATAARVAVAGIAIGPTGTTDRYLYRSLVNASVLRFLNTFAGNGVAAGYTDVHPDVDIASNAVAPTGDTSGFAQPSGQVLGGSVALLTASPATFVSTGGWVVLSSGEAVRYTGITGNTLTGIPASGPGAILTTVLYGSQVLPAPALTGVTGLLLPMLKGTPVHLWVERNDLAAQATQAAIDVANGVTPADGLYEGPPIVDERRGEASLIALCDANLQLFSTPIVTFTYSTRDLKTRSGKTVHINVPGYPVGDYVIQDVTITEIGINPVTAPRFSVTASTVRFSLDDILRKLLTAQAA